ncbi:ATP-grasp domain-containing protein [Limosilactobacillus gastricus]|uniref:Carbamoyl-phosphate synthase large subunit n=1 Tax=Limosilactobacillus gastricus DSM 16045 TaxID=1423749 RepID=A0A0R1VAI1_9LACO|nr:ATP-grasp domain-containing protein [Limosilactobacillus gastricus]KRM02478.1 carbamoyl-phosphate synthase large subunit [Limosilactobacillus gastricus DSM 16045]QGF40199.1 ATP-grasp domain-containing protein [Limosilactobacillus gastricus]
MPSALLVGSGPDNMYSGDELDLTVLNIASAFKARQWETIFVNNNPFSYSLDAQEYIDYPEIRPLTVGNLVALIHQYQPDLIVPTIGGRWIFDLMESLSETGIFEEVNTKLAGVNWSAVQQTNNPSKLERTLKQIDVPMKNVQVVDNYQDAYLMAEQYGFPLIVRSLSPREHSFRHIVHDDQSFQETFAEALKASRIRRVSIQQSLQGLKEIETVVVRDQSGTLMQIATVENMDPIGIHAGDSFAVTPAQTLLDREIQTIRKLAFKITRRLRIVGVNHLQFAVDRAHNRIYVTKVSPYFDRISSFVELATGYPLCEVVGLLYTGERLREINLGEHYVPLTALTEPLMDATAVRIPVFPNSQLPTADWRLGTQKRSIGSAIGIGRSLVEAVLKALTYQETDMGNQRLAMVQQLTDDQLDQLLIHPQNNRFYTLVEALRRGYTSDELAELTQIDPYYFNQFKLIVRLEHQLKTQELTADLFRQAKYWGLPDVTIARLSQKNLDEISQFRSQAQINRTFKEIDPAAGEFEQHSRTFYATFEMENESVAGGAPRALVIGPGPRGLGNGTADDYVTAKMLKTLKEAGYEVIVINDNPSSVTLSSKIADKVYLEPRTSELVNEVAYLEQPEVVFVPQLAHEIIDHLKQLDLNFTLLPIRMIDRPVRILLSQPTYEAQVLFDGQVTYHLGVNQELPTADGSEYLGIDKIYPSDLTADQHLKLNQLCDQEMGRNHRPGVYQLIFTKDHDQFQLIKVQPIPAADIAMLAKALKLDIVGLATKLSLGKFEEAEFDQWQPSNDTRSLHYQDVFPFKSLHLHGQQPSKLTSMGAKIEYLK